ncbi:MAG TPA: SH3 domain-containing protein, partial [Arthrobacter sp.]|nr:SH3 domain-containing protein [Arthrobacter sp.]
AAPKATRSKQATRTTTANVNLRRGAGTSHRILTTVRRGGTVRLTGKRQGVWYQVTYGSRTGWMSSRYLR